MLFFFLSLSLFPCADWIFLCAELRYSTPNFCNVETELYWQATDLSQMQHKIVVSNTETMIWWVYSFCVWCAVLHSNLCAWFCFNPKRASTHFTLAWAAYNIGSRIFIHWLLSQWRGYSFTPSNATVKSPKISISWAPRQVCVCVCSSRQRENFAPLIDPPEIS